MTPASGVSLSAAAEWLTVTPETVGLDGAVLRGLGERFRSSTEDNVHAVLVIRSGNLVYEQYFTGEDERWGEPIGRVEFDPHIKHDLRSVTKSVISLLIGIAIDRKLIAGIDEPVLDFFPEYADLRSPEKDRILLRHLLTMSTGLEWDEYRPYTDPLNSEIRMIWSPDRYRFALEPPVEAPPGKYFRYNSGSSELLGAILRKATGRPLQDYAREALFDPLAITDMGWMPYPNSATPSASGGLRLRPRDTAKLGQLLLAHGQWSGQRIVSAEWIDTSTSPQIGHPDGLFYYGYQWWLGRSLLNRREVLWTAGMGLGGQRIFVVPNFDLVMVITAGLYTSPVQSWLPT
jgi:CubicO group peptidase (beta-lactamase class C family)